MTFFKFQNLSWEAEASGDTAHGGWNQVVEIPVSRVGQPQGTEANVVEGFVVHAESFARILHQMVHCQSTVVRFDNRIWHLESENNLEILRFIKFPFPAFPNRPTLGEGTTEKDIMMRSGYSSFILVRSRVPMPDPVPPPREWVSWTPWRQSALSASLRTTSSAASTNSAPSV